jgi:hypothetical protein
MAISMYLNNNICEYGLNYLSSNGKKLGMVFTNVENEKRIGWTHNGILWSNLTFSITRNNGYSSTLVFDPIDHSKTTIKEPDPYTSPNDLTDIEKKTACFLTLYALCDTDGKYITDPNDLLVSVIDIAKSENLIFFETFPKYIFNNGAKFYIRDFTLSSGIWES